MVQWNIWRIRWAARFFTWIPYRIWLDQPIKWKRNRREWTSSINSAFRRFLRGLAWISWKQSPNQRMGRMWCVHANVHWFTGAKTALYWCLTFDIVSIESFLCFPTVLLFRVLNWTFQNLSWFKYSKAYFSITRLNFSIHFFFIFLFPNSVFTKFGNNCNG